jgi:hypothetical protein
MKSCGVLGVGFQLLIGAWLGASALAACGSEAAPEPKSADAAPAPTPAAQPPQAPPADAAEVAAPAEDAKPEPAANEGREGHGEGRSDGR